MEILKLDKANSLLRNIILGSTPIAGEKIEFDEGEQEEGHVEHCRSRWVINNVTLNTECEITFQSNDQFSCSDFEEDPSGHDQDQSIFDVKNAELCEQIEEDESFELVNLEDPDDHEDEEALVTGDGDDYDSANTRPDSLNKTFT